MIVKYTSEFAKLLAFRLEISADEVFPLIQLAPENIEGDFAFPCFQFSKLLKKAPQMIAQELVDFLNAQSSSVFTQFQAAGPYVNAFLNPEVLAKEVITEIQNQGEEF